MADTFIVIGGGMIGAASALRLQSAGFGTTLIDPGPAEAAASFGNAGHIAVEQVEPLASWRTLRSAPAMLHAFGGPLHFRLSDIGAWGPWAMRFVAAASPSRFRAGTAALTELAAGAVDAWTELLAEVDRRDLIQTDGHAILWFDEAEARRGMAAWTTARTGTATVAPLPTAGLARYQALFHRRPPVAGAQVSGTARLASPQQVRSALLDAFRARGGRVHVGKAVDCERDGTVQLDDGAALAADQVLIATGVRSRALMERLGVPTPLIAERGYSIQLPTTAWPRDLPTAVAEGRSMVFAPHIEGLRVTSYVEFARPDSPADPRKWDRLIARCRALGLVVPDDCQRWIGCRPTLPDYVPAIGRLGERLLYAFGHQHLGVTLAAITAQRVLDLAEGGPADPRFDIGRFSR